jgi:uncharacterized protein DUF1302
VLALCVLLSAARARAVEVPGTGGRIVAGGWLDGLAVAPTEDSPRQIPSALLDLHFDAEATRWLHGRLDLRAHAGGPFEGGHGGVFNLNHEFQNHSLSLDVNEAYVDVHLQHADARLGMQKVAWGKLDGIPPTDVVNPRDFHDPIVQDFEERKIGIPMALGTYYLPDAPRLDLTDLRATFLWVPIAVPPRLALAEERWFPTSTVPPSKVHVTAGDLGQALATQFPHGIDIGVQFGTANQSPPRGFEDGGVGFRLAGTWRQSDWDIYHYTGPETGPDADLTVDLHSTPKTILPITAVTLLKQTHDSIHMTGADAATVLGGLTVRAEVAHFDDRPYLRLASDVIADGRAAVPVPVIVGALAKKQQFRLPLEPLFPSLDSVEWGIGADYLIHGWQPLLQLNQIILLQRAPTLLIGNPDSRLVGSLKKKFLAERLELELRGTYAIEQQAWFFFPRVSYLVRDDLRLRLGYLAIDGPRTSLLGQFRANDEVVIQARYSF